MSEPNYDAIFSSIDSKKSRLISLLAEAVAIPSVSAEPERRPEIIKMVDWAKKHLEQLGVTCEVVQLGEQKQKLPDGKTIALPPIIIGNLGADSNKKTLLVYAHLDVQPANKEDGWNTDPFKLTEKDGKLYGRGSTDDKGPFIAWLGALETLKEMGIELPVNLKFCLEGMEESGSEGLEGALRARKDSFLKDVSFTCISDNYWLGTSKPCLTYGLRGISYFTVEVSGPEQDLHSGIYGGTLHEPMTDLVWVLSQLLSKDGDIMIPGLADHVLPLTEKERELYTKMDFDKDEYAKHINTTKLLKATKEETLMARMRYPSLSVHGIEGAFHGAGAKTVIPCKVTGKFSIRLVPDMKPEVIDKLVVKHLNELWSQRGSPNQFKATAFHSGPAWLADPHGPNFQAGARAIKRVYGIEPDYTREGGSIPVTLTFQELTGAPVMLLPIGANDDMAHSQNEKINVSNLVQGTKTLAAYILELAKA